MTLDYQTVSSLDEAERAMEHFVHERFLQQPCFLTLQRGQWDRQRLQHFSWQYAHYSAHFPRVLGAAISAMEPDDTWWIPLADNLWDEAGRGRPGASHARLYGTYMASVDPSAATRFPHRAEWPPMGGSVRTAIESFVRFFYHATPWDAMGAVGLGSEFFAGTVMGAIAQGMRHPRYQQAGPIDTTFWDVHADADEPRHYALCRAVFMQNASTSDDWTRLLAIGKQIAHTEATMYEGIFHEADTGTLPNPPGMD